MSVLPVRWQLLIDRRSCRALQGFTCTQDPPRSPGGRKLPHPRHWEWETQSHLRQLPRRLPAGDVVLVGYQAENRLVAAAHLHCDADGSELGVFIAALAVSCPVRGQGGHVADATVMEIRDCGLERARRLGYTRVAITGKIHTANDPSRRMVERAGFEPVGVPAGDYQMWHLVVPVVG